MCRYLSIDLRYCYSCSIVTGKCVSRTENDPFSKLLHKQISEKITSVSGRG